MPTTNHQPVPSGSHPDTPNPMHSEQQRSTVVDGRRNDRRSQLVAGAMKLFRSRGPNGTGIAAICEAGDATKGVFSHHFPGGKDEIVLEVVRQNASEVDEIVGNALLNAESVSEAVQTIFNLYADLLDHDPDFGCPLAAAVVDASSDNETIRELTSSSFQRWQLQLSNAIVADRMNPTPQATDGQTSQDAQAVAVTIVASMEGAILLARAQRDPSILRRTGAVVATLLR